MTATSFAAPDWRSILYVPANAPRFIASAHRRGADAIALDLEDSVPPSEKELARSGLRAAARTVGQGGADVVVRINRPLSLAVRDIEAAVCSDVQALMITKVEGPSHVRLLDELVTECEAREGLTPRAIRFILLIETAAAFDAMPEIAAASPRTMAMALGSEDLALDCDFVASDEVMLYPKQRLILAARAAGIVPIGYIGSIVSLDDDAAFRAMVRRSRQFGFSTATCIHPRQVAIVNDEYGVQPGELALARRIVDEGARHAAAGIGAFKLDGKLIDAPIVERAERVIRRAQTLAEPPL
ncbi:MAG: CoA ester lyase [Variovorax sp.]|nr:CoA ester lyase [Variovorax sp.]